MLRHLVQLFQEAQGPFGVAVLRILAEVNFNAARVFVYVRHQGNLAALFVIVGLVYACCIAPRSGATRSTSWRVLGPPSDFASPLPLSEVLTRYLWYLCNAYLAQIFFIDSFSATPTDWINLAIAKLCCFHELVQNLKLVEDIPRLSLVKYFDTACDLSLST
jgi:hypothetical protein